MANKHKLKPIKLELDVCTVCKTPHVELKKSREKCSKCKTQLNRIGSSKTNKKPTKLYFCNTCGIVYEYQKGNHTRKYQIPYILNWLKNIIGEVL